MSDHFSRRRAFILHGQSIKPGFVASLFPATGLAGFLFCWARSKGRICDVTFPPARFHFARARRKGGVCDITFPPPAWRAFSAVGQWLKAVSVPHFSCRLALIWNRQVIKAGFVASLFPPPVWRAFGSVGWGSKAKFVTSLSRRRGLLFCRGGD